MNLYLFILVIFVFNATVAMEEVESAEAVEVIIDDPEVDEINEKTKKSVHAFMDFLKEAAICNIKVFIRELLPYLGFSNELCKRLWCDMNHKIKQKVEYFEESKIWHKDEDTFAVVKNLFKDLDYSKKIEFIVDCIKAREKLNQVNTYCDPLCNNVLAACKEVFQEKYPYIVEVLARKMDEEQAEVKKQFGFYIADYYPIFKGIRNFLRTQVNDLDQFNKDIEEVQKIFDRLKKLNQNGEKMHLLPEELNLIINVLYYRCVQYHEEILQNLPFVLQDEAGRYICNMDPQNIVVKFFELCRQHLENIQQHKIRFNMAFLFNCLSRLCRTKPDI